MQFRILFLWGFVLTLITFLFFILAFISPYWLQSFPKANSEFIRIGLWEACFAGFRHYGDYLGNRFNGCQFILSRDYFWIRSWLIPWWFALVMFANVVSLILLVFCLAIQCYIFVSRKNTYVLSLLATVFIGVAFLLEFITAIIFGVMSNDWYWMPRPDYNFLSWGYYFMITSLIGMIFSGIPMFIYSRHMKVLVAKEQAKQQETQSFKSATHRPPPPPTSAHGARTPQTIQMQPMMPGHGPYGRPSARTPAGTIGSMGSVPAGPPPPAGFQHGYPPPPGHPAAIRYGFHPPPPAPYGRSVSQSRPT